LFAQVSDSKEIFDKVREAFNEGRYQIEDVYPRMYEYVGKILNVFADNRAKLLGKEKLPAKEEEEEEEAKKEEEEEEAEEVKEEEAKEVKEGAPPPPPPPMSGLEIKKTRGVTMPTGEELKRAAEQLQKPKKVEKKKAKRQTGGGVMAELQKKIRRKTETTW